MLVAFRHSLRFLALRGCEAWLERQRIEREPRLAQLRHVSHLAMQRLLRETRT